MTGCHDRVSGSGRGWLSRFALPRTASRSAPRFAMSRRTARRRAGPSALRWASCVNRASASRASSASFVRPGTRGTIAATRRAWPPPRFRGPAAWPRPPPPPIAREFVRPSARASARARRGRPPASTIVARPIFRTNLWATERPIAYTVFSSFDARRCSGDGHVISFRPWSEPYPHRRVPSLPVAHTMAHGAAAGMGAAALGTTGAREKSRPRASIAAALGCARTASRPRRGARPGRGASDDAAGRRADGSGRSRARGRGARVERSRRRRRASRPPLGRRRRRRRRRRRLRPGRGAGSSTLAAPAGPRASRRSPPPRAPAASSVRRGVGRHLPRLAAASANAPPPPPSRRRELARRVVSSAAPGSSSSSSPPPPRRRRARFCSRRSSSRSPACR